MSTSAWFRSSTWREANSSVTVRSSASSSSFATGSAFSASNSESHRPPERFPLLHMSGGPFAQRTLGATSFSQRSAFIVFGHSTRPGRNLPAPGSRPRGSAGSYAAFRLNLNSHRRTLRICKHRSYCHQHKPQQVHTFPLLWVNNSRIIFIPAPRPKLHRPAGLHQICPRIQQLLLTSALILANLASFPRTTTSKRILPT